MGSSVRWQLLHILSQRERFRRGERNQHAATGGGPSGRDGLACCDDPLDFQLAASSPRRRTRTIAVMGESSHVDAVVSRPAGVFKVPQIVQPSSNPSLVPFSVALENCSAAGQPYSPAER
jgi:hypothetical protein